MPSPDTKAALEPSFRPDPNEIRIPQRLTQHTSNTVPHPDPCSHLYTNEKGTGLLLNLY